MNDDAKKRRAEAIAYAANRDRDAIYKKAMEISAKLKREAEEGPVAQLAEPPAHNRTVSGSSPDGPICLSPVSGIYGAYCGLPANHEGPHEETIPSSMKDEELPKTSGWFTGFREELCTKVYADGLSLHELEGEEFIDALAEIFTTVMELAACEGATPVDLLLRWTDKRGPGWFDPEEYAVQSDPFWEWREKHHEEIEEHAGNYIAIHPGKGIVASDPSYAVVHERVIEMGLQDEVMIDKADGGVGWI